MDEMAHGRPPFAELMERPQLTDPLADAAWQAWQAANLMREQSGFGSGGLDRQWVEAAIEAMGYRLADALPLVMALEAEWRKAVSERSKSKRAPEDNDRRNPGPEDQ